MEAPRSAVMSSPPRRTSPAVGSVSLATIRAVVDLPDPDSPTSEKVVPLGMVNETSSTARNVALAPAARGRPNSLTRFFTAITGGAAGGSLRIGSTRLLCPPDQG